MSDVLVGLTGPIWGTIGDTQIIVDNIRESFDGGNDDLTDGDGDILATVFHGDKGEITMDFKIRNSGAAYFLARGAAITLPSGESDINSGSETLYLVSWEKTKSKGDFMGGTLTANYYPDMS